MTNKRSKKNPKKTLHHQLRQLNEDFGRRFNAEELSAKKRYEAALEALALWDIEYEKKQAFEAAREIDGRKHDSARRYYKINRPELVYDADVLRTSRRTLENKLQKEKEKYLSYSPDDPEIEDEFYDIFNKKTKEYEEPRVEQPEPNADKILDINDIIPCTWYKWPPEVKKSGIKYGSTSTDGEVQAGVGPGEGWLEYMLGAKVQGGSVSFDIVTHDGRKWEAKQIEKKSETVRPGTKGTQLYNKVRHKLVGLLDKIKEFVELFESDPVSNSELFDEKSLKIINQTLKVFTDIDYEMIVNKGEIGTDRLLRIRSVLRQVSKLKRINNVTSKEHEISIGNRRISLNSAIFADIVKKIESETDYRIIGDDDSEQRKSFLMSHFESGYFDDYTGFLDEWYESFKVPDVFEGVDGIFIVNPQGFLLVPWDDIPSSFAFTHITQNLPRFALKLPFGP